MARDPAEERRTVALETIAAALVRLDERAEVFNGFAERALDYLDKWVFPSVMERALRALPRCVKVGQVASVYRRASLLVGPSERDVLFLECALVAASCVGADAFEGEAPSAAFVAEFRRLCTVKPCPHPDPRPKAAASRQR